MNPTIMFLGLLGVFMLENFIFMVWWLLNKRWDIPIVILRFVGSKGRPLLIPNKGRKDMRNGVPVLRVKGYQDPIRDFKNELYWPTVRSKYGALVLWEFEDGMLTPCVPATMIDKLDADTKKRLDATLKEIRATKWIEFNFQSPFWRKTVGSFFEKLVAKSTYWNEKIALHKPKQEHIDQLQKSLDSFQTLQTVPFEFDAVLHKQLKLKAVDDVDIDWMLQEKARIDSQYSGGWRDFLARYGGHIALILIAAMMLVGVIFAVLKLPELMQACGAQGVETAKSFIAEMAKSVGGAASSVPPG